MARRPRFARQLTYSKPNGCRLPRKSSTPHQFEWLPVFTDYWRGAQSWVADVRPKRGTFGDSVADRLTELRLTGAKVGTPWAILMRAAWLIQDCPDMCVFDCASRLIGMHGKENFSLPRVEEHQYTTTLVMLLSSCIRSNPLPLSLRYIEVHGGYRVSYQRIRSFSKAETKP